MKQLLTACLAIGLLWSCGDEKGKESEADEPKVTLETEADRISYAMGASNGSSMRSSIDDPEEGIADKVDYDRILKGCNDGFGDEFEMTPEEMQEISNEFLAKVQTDEEMDDDLIKSFSYFVGVNVTKNTMNQMNMLQSEDMLNKDIYAAGFKDGLMQNELLIPEEDGMELVRNFFTDKQNEMMQKAQAEAMEVYPINKAEGDEFLAENKTKPGIVTTETGLQYEIIKAGSGPKPTLNDKVLAHYHGTLLDGTIFDSSVDRGEPIEFDVTGVISGWTEALQLMPVGSKWKLYVPEELAYGKNPRPGGAIQPGMMLIFEVELLEIR